MPLDADLVVVNARILTMDDAAPTAEALALRGDRLAHVGDRAGAEAFAGPSTRTFDAGGRLLMPAFVDAHTHLVQYGLQLLRLNLSRVADREELLELVRERVGMTPTGGWIVGYGWDESKWSDRSMPTRSDLDAIAPNHPVLLCRVDMHMGVLNSRGLEATGFAPADHDQGHLREENFNRAFDAVTPSTGTMVQGLARATRALHEMGVASCHVVCDDRDVRALLEARRQGRLGVRCTLYYRAHNLDALLATGLAPPFGDEWLKLGGLKLFTDGSIGSRTAAVTRGYADDADHKGELMYPRESLHDLVRRAHEARLQVALHAIGDAAVEEALVAVEEGQRASPRGDARHRIEHLEIFTPDQAKRLLAAGMIASMQPNFIGEWGHPGMMYESRLGPWIVPEHNRLREVLDLGIPLAFGSDHMPTGPLYGVHCAVNAPSSRQRIGVEEALRAYTRGGAFAGRDEDHLGVLKSGALADFILLDRDVREDPANVKAARVMLTVVGGRIVHAAMT